MRFVEIKRSGKGRRETGRRKQNSRGKKRMRDMGDFRHFTNLLHGI